MLPLVRSARLELRPFMPNDVDRLHALWNDPHVRRYLWDGEIIPRDRAAETVHAAVSSARIDGIGMWCFSERGAEALAGFAGFRRVPTTSHLELLYALGPGFTGRGLATEASRAALTWLFATRRPDRVLAGADAPNAASFRVMERLGMRRIGALAEVPGAIYYELRAADFVPDAAVEW